MDRACENQGMKPDFKRSDRPRPLPPSRSGPSHQIRIIGGIWRRRTIPVLAREGLRPTPDRVRETVFNWLGQTLQGQRALDLFAGTGALGFEAASRGAERVVMIDADTQVVAGLRATATRLAATQVEIRTGDALAWLAKVPIDFDVIFVDPPYGKGLVTQTLNLLAPRLPRHAWVYAESNDPLELQHPQLVAVRKQKAGAVHFALLQLPATSPS
jgi:16S rRNA (guanine966-N2)-methyltransferase